MMSREWIGTYTSGMAMRSRGWTLLLFVMNNMSTAFGDDNATVSTPLITCCGPEVDDGLSTADIVAIVMGIILLCVIVVAIVLCILMKKGYIGRTPEEQPKVNPVLSDFSTSAHSLRDCSFVAMCRTRKKRPKRPKKDPADPIIYIYDDIYHPPNSRPLPNGNIPTERYPEYVKSVTKPKTHACRKSRDKIPIQGKHRNPDPPDTSEPEIDEDILVMPDTSKLSFTTHYGTRAPYSDWI